MPKSKEHISTSESDSGSENEAEKKSKKRREKQPSKKEAPPKKTKKDDSESDTCWELGNNRQISVREFKGKLLIDIREMYTDSTGDLKPGKKGIALSAQQWKKLVSVMEEVEGAVNKH